MSYVANKTITCTGIMCYLSNQQCCITASRLGDDGEGDAAYYILLRACEEFYSEYSRYPGWYDDQVEADIPLLKVAQLQILYPLK